MSRSRRGPVLGGTGQTGARLNAPMPTQQEREAVETAKAERPKSELDYLFGGEKELENLDKSISELLLHQGGLIGSTRANPYTRLHIVFPKHIYGSTLSFYDDKKKKEIDDFRKERDLGPVKHTEYSLIREKMTSGIGVDLTTGENLGPKIIVKDFGQPYVSKKNEEFFKDLETISKNMKTDDENLLIVVRGVKGSDDDNSRKNYLRGTYFYCHQRGKTVVQEERRFKITNELIKFYANNVHNSHIRFTMHNYNQQEGEYLNCLARFDTKRDKKTILEAMKDEIIMTLCDPEKIGADYGSEDDYINGIEDFIVELFGEVRDFFKEKKYLQVPRQRTTFRTDNLNTAIDYIVKRGYLETFGLELVEPNQRGGEITFADVDGFVLPMLDDVHQNLRKVMEKTMEMNLNEYENRVKIEEMLKEKGINFLSPVIFANHKKLYNEPNDKKFIVIKSINTKLAQVIVDKFLELYFIPFRKRIRELRILRLMFFEYKDNGYFLRSGKYSFSDKPNRPRSLQKNPEFPPTTVYSNMFEIPNAAEGATDENIKKGKDYTLLNKIMAMFKGENKYIDPKVLNIGDVHLLLKDFNFIRRNRNAMKVYKKAERFLSVTDRTKQLNVDLDFPNPFRFQQGTRARKKLETALENQIKKIILDGVMEEYKDANKFRKYDEERKKDIVDSVMWYNAKRRLRILKKGLKKLTGEDLKNKKTEIDHKNKQYIFWNPGSEQQEKLPRFLNKLAEFTIKYGAGVFFCQIRNDPTKLTDPEDFKSKVKSIFKVSETKDEIENEAVQRKMLVFSSEQDPSEILFNYCLYGFRRRKKPFFIGEKNVMKDYYHNALQENFITPRMKELGLQKDPRYFQNVTYVEDVDEFYKKMGYDF